MKQIKLIIALLVVSMSVCAQEPGNETGNRRENMQRIKIAYISKAVNLTSQQAERFWPIYNNYNTELLEIRKARRGSFKGMADNNDSKSEEVLNAMMDSKQRELDLQKKYKNEFLKVINANQLLELYKAEKQFNEAVVRKMMERRQNQGNGARGNGQRFRGGNGQRSLQEPKQR